MLAIYRDTGLNLVENILGRFTYGLIGCLDLVETVAKIAKFIFIGLFAASYSGKSDFLNKAVEASIIDIEESIQKVVSSFSGIIDPEKTCIEQYALRNTLGYFQEFLLTESPQQKSVAVPILLIGQITENGVLYGIVRIQAFIADILFASTGDYAEFIEDLSIIAEDFSEIRGREMAAMYKKFLKY